MSDHPFRNSIIESGMIRAGDVLINPLNPRRHPQEQREVVKASIEEFGWVKRIIINKRTGELVDGEERIWEALASPEGEDTLVPYDMIDASEQEQNRIIMVLDRSSEMAIYDKERIEELSRQDPEWENKTLQALRDKLAEEVGAVTDDETEEDPGAQIDRAAELNKKWQVQPGDLWQIGEHRLLCGDSTNADDVARLGIDDALMMVTDPPYGVNYDPQWRTESFDTLRTGSKINNDDSLLWLGALTLFNGDVVYIWCASWLAHHIGDLLERADYSLRNLIIWNKDLQVIGRGHYHWKHEPCWYAVRSDAKAHWAGSRDQTTVWDIPTIHSFANGHNREEWGLVGHGNQKPLECMARPIRNHTAQIIYDPFGGSGTTMVASEQLNRQCRMMEISENYSAVILERMSGMGLEPKLISRGGQSMNDELSKPDSDRIVS